MDNAIWRLSLAGILIGLLLIALGHWLFEYQGITTESQVVSENKSYTIIGSAIITWDKRTAENEKHYIKIPPDY